MNIRIVMSAMLLLFSNTLAYAQALPAIAVGTLLNDAEDAAENLIQKGFDRMDMTVVRAGYEARGTILTARQDFEGVIDKAADTFEETRENTISDILQLTRALKSDGKEVVEEVRKASNEVLSSITVILTNGVGSIQIAPPLAEWGDKMLDIRIIGVALSQLSIEKFMLDNEKVDFSIVEQDDQQATIRIPLITSGNATRVSNREISFQIRKPKWFEWLRGKTFRNFKTVAVIVPRDVGSVTAVYSAEQTNVVRSARSTRRETGRVQSRIRGFPPRIRRGSWSGSYNFAVANGEKFVRGSVRLSPSTNSGCHGSSTRAVLGAENDREFRVDVSIASDRRAGATCRMQLSVSYSVEVATTSTVERKQTISPLKLGKRGVLNAADISQGVKNVRLAYVNVESPLFKNGEKRVLPNEKVQWAQLEIDAASGYSYVTISLD